MIDDVRRSFRDYMVGVREAEHDPDRLPIPPARSPQRRELAGLLDLADQEIEAGHRSLSEARANVDRVRRALHLDASEARRPAGLPLRRG